MLIWLVAPRHTATRFWHFRLTWMTKMLCEGDINGFKCSPARRNTLNSDLTKFDLKDCKITSNFALLLWSHSRPCSSPKHPLGCASSQIWTMRCFLSETEPITLMENNICIQFIRLLTGSTHSGEDYVDVRFIMNVHRILDNRQWTVQTKISKPFEI